MEKVSYYALDANSGVGGFSWFDSLEQALTHLSEEEPKLLVDEDSRGLNEITGSFRSVADAARTGNISTSEIPASINASMSNDRFWLEWFGTYSDLEQGNSEFAKDVLESYEQEKADSRVNGEAPPTFEEFLQNYRA